MDIKPGDLEILRMLRQEVFFLEPGYGRPGLYQLWEGDVVELGSFTSDPSSYKRWKIFVRRIGKKAVLRSLLEFVPVIEARADIREPAWLEAKKSERQENKDFDRDLIVELMNDWATTGNDTRGELKQYLDHNIQKDRSLDHYVDCLLHLAVGPKKLTYYFSSAFHILDSAVYPRRVVEQCIKHKVAEDILDRYFSRL